MTQKSKHISATPATQWLKAHGVSYEGLSYDWIEHGGTAQSASALQLDEHAVIKTLIMQDESANPLVILMHGDCEVSVKNLARQIGCKSVTPCSIEQAQRNSGYLVGGTSPFGTRKRMPVYMQCTIAELPAIYINGGRRGFLVKISPSVLTDLLKARPVDVALAD